jgi:hypothetical protein
MKTVIRRLRKEEIDLIIWMIRGTEESEYINPSLTAVFVEEMRDGGMGSLRVVAEMDRIYSRDLANIELLDKDGIPLWISVYLDTDDNFFELDVWKVDYSRLVQFPSVPM